MTEGQTVTGGQKVTDGQTVTGGQTVHGDTTHYGNDTTYGNQTVGGDSHINGNQVVDKDQTVGGDSHINGNQVVSVAQLAILECVHAFDVTCGDEAHKAFRRAVDRVFKRESRRFKAYMESVETALHIDESAEALGLTGGDEQDPHRQAVLSEVRELVRKCLNSLTEEEQRFLRLRCQHDLTYEDVAKRCGLSLSQAHKLTKAAMVKFHEGIYGCDVE